MPHIRSPTTPSLPSIDEDSPLVSPTYASTPISICLPTPTNVYRILAAYPFSFSLISLLSCHTHSFLTLLPLYLYFVWSFPLLVSPYPLSHPFPTLSSLFSFPSSSFPYFLVIPRLLSPSSVPRAYSII
jgi:hypothetical protein